MFFKGFKLKSKECKTCRKTKMADQFYKHPKSSDGLFSSCKECKKIYERNCKNYINYDKTEKGLIRVIYKTQKSNSKRRGHTAPTYTKHELRDWMYSNGFTELYNHWVKSGYKKELKPSCDRVDDYKGYSIDNIILTTWGENKKKQTEDILLGRSTSGERCKPVLQFTKDGELINEFISYSEAKRTTGISNIDGVCLGRRISAGGFIWKYK